jgi:two-component system cell cycle sensor histidine kinase/response regulator CckA
MAKPAAILIVEDDPTVRTMAHVTLAQQGWRTLVAAGATEGITRVIQYEGPIPLAIVDIVMPEIGGLDFANQLHSARPTTQVLYISGNSSSVAVDSILAQDPDSVLRKPFTGAELLDRVRALLAR